ncbi:MAG: DUF456 domain-containing protein [Bacteroidales bacterium]|nr:DUF456 domain-containing protein [Bacteroidales bacterium]
MDIFLIIMAFVCLLVGIVGSIVPGLPGPPISWVGLLVAGFTPWVANTPALLIVTAAVAIFITVMDYVIPSLTTKRFGGSKYGIWGCNIGLVVSIFGLPFGPTGLLGMVFWPFIGALIGEFIKQQDFQPALKAGFGAFVGFLTGTLLKVVYCIAILIVVIAAMV